MTLNKGEEGVQEQRDKKTFLLRKPQASTNPDYLSTAQAAYLLGVSHHSIRSFFQKKLLAGFKIGRSLRIYAWSVKQYLASHQTCTNQEEGGL